MVEKLVTEEELKYLREARAILRKKGYNVLLKKIKNKKRGCL
jgi:hypothetical protein